MTVLFLCGFLGFMSSLVQQYLKYQPRIVQQGGFSPLYYARDNASRIVLGFLACIAGVMFYPDVFNEQLKPFTAYLLCFFHDKIIDTYTNRKK